MVVTRAKEPRLGAVLARLWTRSARASRASVGSRSCPPWTHDACLRPKTGTEIVGTSPPQVGSFDASRLTNAVSRTSRFRSSFVSSRAYVSRPLISRGTRKIRFRPTCSGGSPHSRRRRKLSTNPMPGSIQPGGTASRRTPRAAFQPRIRDRAATASRERANRRGRPAPPLSPPGRPHGSPGHSSVEG